jgi:DNA modification methylase
MQQQDLFGDLFPMEQPPKNEEPEIIPQDVDTICKYGDIWQLGDHLLMCADSTREDNVAKLMNGERADLVFTDPPYGMKKENKGVLNDNQNLDELLAFNKRWIPITFRHMKENGSWYCWGIVEPLMDIYCFILRPMMKAKQITFRNLITWKKGAFGSGGGTGVGQAIQLSYFPETEHCLFVQGGDVKKDPRTISSHNEVFEPIRKWFEIERIKSGLSTKQLSEIDSTRVSHYWAKNQHAFPIESAYMKIQNYCKAHNIDAFQEDYAVLKEQYDKLKAIYNEQRGDFYSTRAYFNNTHDMMTDVWDFQRVRGKERAECGGHATPKPLALCGRAIKSSSREGEIVLDVFGGSGSTLIACEQLHRKCRMIELDPYYCDVIIARWEKMTGRKAEQAQMTLF